MDNLHLHWLEIVTWSVLMEIRLIEEWGASEIQAKAISAPLLWTITEVIMHSCQEERRLLVCVFVARQSDLHLIDQPGA